MHEDLMGEGVACYERIGEAGEMDVVTMFHVLEHFLELVPLFYRTDGILAPEYSP